MAETKIKKFRHVSLAVENAEAVMDSWSNIMGIGPWTCIDMKGTDRKGRPWTGKEYWKIFIPDPDTNSTTPRPRPD